MFVHGHAIWKKQKKQKTQAETNWEILILFWKDEYLKLYSSSIGMDLPVVHMD